MKKILSCLLVLHFFSTLSGDIESRIEGIKERIEDTKCFVRYYGPYAFCSTLSLGSFSIGPKCGAMVLASLGFYSLYSTLKGYKEIKAIQKKYKVKTQMADYWNDFYQDESFLFCRWRQQDDHYGDGFYWPTAWLCNEERKEVRNVFIQDIHAQRIGIVSNGNKTKKPKPSQVITAISKELDAIEKDKKQLQAYTNVYRSVEQPEAFHPDTSIKRLFWPNYNRASNLYIELVQMMKRLRVIRDIVAGIRAETSSDRWPKV